MTVSVANGETSAMLRMMHWTGMLVLAGLITGCAHLYDITDDCMTEWKCCHAAKMAWHRSRDLYADVAYPFDFGQGFRDGYESVCMGGEGCPPAMPPRHYWSHHYQCDEGRCQIMAWYDGYHHGVLAAQCDGCEGRCQVLCAHDLYGQKPCETDHSEIEHRVVPESEMPNLPPSDMYFGPGMDMYAPMPLDALPLDAPPAPADPNPGRVSIPSSNFEEGTEVGPTSVPALRQMLAPGVDANAAPSF
jgi:hypothetical protein